MARTLKEILLEQTTKITELGKDGTYIAVRFNRATQNKLRKLTKQLGIPNEQTVPREKLHCTVVYSRKPFKDFTIKGKMDEPIKAEPDKLEIFKTQSGANALVLRFHSKELDDRHNYFNDEFGATYDYDEYKQHVTLSYDVGDWKIPKSFDPKSVIDSLEMDEEYYEALNLDWTKENSGDGMVISGFPGVGKSTLVKKAAKDKVTIHDSDSSTFAKDSFPGNYVKHIKDILEKKENILISSHKEVRDALIKEEIPFLLVYPDKSLKDEYMKRYEERGSGEKFLKLLDENFNEWVKECDELDSPLVTKVVLKKGEYLGSNDKVKELLKI